MVSFSLSGDPGAIRASASTWGEFGTTTQGAVTNIGSLQFGEFQGSEGDTFSHGVNDDLVPHLGTTSEAWTIVSSALTTYAGTLEHLQSRLSALAAKHGSQQATVNSANANYQQAKTDDSQHQKSLTTQQSALKPGQAMPPDTYQSHTGSKQETLTTAQADLASTENQAQGIHTQHGQALSTCVSEVNRAKHLRFQKPPGFWDKVGGTFSAAWSGIKKGVSWAAAHISPILKMVSMVSGMLALIPCLAPIMGPIALVTGGAALSIDLANKLMNGQGSWSQMGLDALGLVPGVKSLSALGKMGKLAEDGSKLGGALRTMGKADTFWAITNNFAGKGQFAVTAYMAANGINGKNWGDVAVAGLGIKMPMASDRFNSIQNVVTGAGGFANQGYKNINALAHGKSVTPLQWVAMVSQGGKAGFSGRNLKAYSSEGTNPDGSTRAANSNPKYGWPDTKNAVTGTKTWQSGSGKLAATVLRYELAKGPSNAPAPRPSTSISAPR
ncbi:MAG: putative T7SS-secreted protein [Nakamurella sp.]